MLSRGIKRKKEKKKERKKERQDKRAIQRNIVISEQRNFLMAYLIYILTSKSIYYTAWKKIE